MTNAAWVALEITGSLVAISLAWRWASRIWPLPCPSLLAGTLDSSFLQRFNGTRVTLERLGLQPGQRLLEIGAGPGRLLIPAARQILPGGEAVGIDVQRGMIDRLERNIRRAGATNITTILGDAAQPLVPEESFDLVVMCTSLGEIPRREAGLEQAFRALKSGGSLSVTEMMGDPHYQSRAVVQSLAERAGFRLVSIRGNWWLFTATFVKP